MAESMPPVGENSNSSVGLSWGLRSNYLKMSPRAKRGVQSPLEHGPDAIGFGVTAVLTHEVLQSQDLNSSVASFLRDDMGRFEIDSEPWGMVGVRSTPVFVGVLG